MTKSRQLEGRSWLVTGASRGIGREICLDLARRGASLELVARDEQALEETAAACRAHEVSATTHPTDLAKPRQRDALILKLTRERGQALHGLVNNAGFSQHGDFAELNESAIREMIAVNLLAPTLLARALLPAMVAAGEGHLMDVASMSGWMPVPRESIYAATKAFLVSHDQSLAEELRDTGVRVTCVAPGLTETDFFARANLDLDSYDLRGFPQGSARDVARAAVEGALAGRRRVIPGFRNRILAFGLRHAPRSWTRRLARRVNARNAGAPES
jgi:uncharacterized protein